jgi:flagellar biosynthesis protein FliR
MRSMGESLLIDPRAPATFFLVSARLAAVLLVTPLGALAVTPVVRVLLVLALALVLTAGLPNARLPAGFGAGALFGALAAEVAVGIVMGLGIAVAFAAFSIAGGMLDVQIGYGIAQVFDPVTRRQLPILTSIFGQLAVAAFFLGDWHLQVLRGLAYGLERWPPGAVDWSALDGAAVLGHAAALFSLGFALAAPVVFFIFLLDCVLGVLTRNLPQMQMFALAIPLKVVAGAGALALWFVASRGVMERTYASVFRSWEALFR